MRKLVVMVFVIVACCCYAEEKKEQLTLSVDGKPVLTMQMAEGWTSKIDKDKTILKPAKAGAHMQLWQMAKAKDIAEAIALVPEVLKSEVTDFKATETKDITVAGAPAKHLIGKGTEADDGDPSNAEVFLFTAGGKVFLLCAHGEGESASKQRNDILALLATAK